MIRNEILNRISEQNKFCVRNFETLHMKVKRNSKMFCKSVFSKF